MFWMEFGKSFAKQFALFVHSRQALSVFFEARNAMRGCISPRARRPMHREEREEWHKEMHGTKWPKERKRNEIKGKFLWFLTTSLPCWLFIFFSFFLLRELPENHWHSPHGLARDNATKRSASSANPSMPSGAYKKSSHSPSLAAVCTHGLCRCCSFLFFSFSVAYNNVVNIHGISVGISRASYTQEIKLIFNNVIKSPHLGYLKFVRTRFFSDGSYKRWQYWGASRLEAEEIIVVTRNYSLFVFPISRSTSWALGYFVSSLLLHDRIGLS